MSRREGLDWIALVSIFCILLILIVLTCLLLQGRLSLEGYVIGAGTLLLAMATFYLAYIERLESSSNRIQNKELAEKERRRLWLKEILEELYSPLFGNLTLFHVGDREKTKSQVIDPFMGQYLIRDKYLTMASDKLRELLDRYFHMTEVDIRMEHGKPNDTWKALLDEIRETIQIDFEKLKNEYNELTDS